VKLDMQCCADDEMEMREVRLSKATPGNVSQAVNVRLVSQLSLCEARCFGVMKSRLVGGPLSKGGGSKVKMKEKKARSRLIAEPALMMGRGAKLRCMDFAEKAKLVGSARYSLARLGMVANENELRFKVFIA
jgi:hypothetical protein